ncbi:MAG: hypothetical protein MUO61_07070, partial [Dehalococcoidia bacterium]|nr:hypothetical protein [Dehalococcoidia bacterium]
VTYTAMLDTIFPDCGPTTAPQSAAIQGYIRITFIIRNSILFGHPAVLLPRGYVYGVSRYPPGQDILH